VEESPKAQNQYGQDGDASHYSHLPCLFEKTHREDDRKDYANA
jgi:hypothetical protein